MAQAVEAVVVVKVHLRVDGKVGSSKWLAHIGRVGEISHARDGISHFGGLWGACGMVTRQHLQTFLD